MSLKSNKNLIGSETEYNRYYTGFRGVDFSSDHTQVNEKRLAYLVNMYRDYQTGQGEALETVPGFRKRFIAPGTDASPPIYGIFQFDKRGVNGVLERSLIIHAGKHLYEWKDNLHETVNVPLEATINFTEEVIISGSKYRKQSSDAVAFKGVDHIISAYYIDEDGTHITVSKDAFKMQDGLLCYLSSEKASLNITYYENIITDSLTTMAEHKSVGFTFNNEFYILDGSGYKKYDGRSVWVVGNNTVSTIPILYQGIQVGENATTGKELQQANLLNEYGVFTFIADGVTKEYVLPRRVYSISSITVYGTEVAKENYTLTTSAGVSKIVFADGFDAPKKPSEAGYSESYAGVEVKADLSFGSTSSDIEDCTLAEVFDNRVFLSGNPYQPTKVWFSKLNDPSYFGELDYEQIGVDNAPVTGLMAIADSLLVLRGDSEQDGAAFFLARVETNENLKPIAYSSTKGLNGIGCLGACRNFLDDPVFISKLGMEAIGQLSVRLERAKEHRSTLVDAKLVNSNLKEASMCEWGGYLWVLVDGQIFLADSRQRWQNALGNAEYEWYYLNNIAVYDGQWEEFFYANTIPDYLLTIDIDGYPLEIKYGYEGKTANEFEDASVSFAIKPIIIGGESYNAKIDFAREVDDYGKMHVYLVGSKGSMTGGTPHNAKIIASVNDNVYFGTDNGVICSFNLDQRNRALGTIPSSAYSFDGRTIVSGCATLMDNCGILHLTKSTIKRSTVIKTKAFSRSAAKVRVRTNKNPYKQIARINNSTFSFDDVDFSDFTFITTDQTLYSIKEKEKHWVEKQYYVYSDEYCSPFALYYISYRYKVAGRLKT
jgi:hypothetical protein